MQGFLIPLSAFPSKWYNCCNELENKAFETAMKKILKDKRVIVVLLVIILVLLLMDFNQRMVLLSKLRGQEKELTQKYANLVATREMLETELAYANSDEAVEKWAREEAGMIQDGDIPIVLLPPSTPVTTESPPQEEVVEEVRTWDIWRELFLGE
jgi:cell division protein FtsB